MGQVQYPFDLGAAAANPSMAQAGIDYETGKMALDYRSQLAKSLLQDSEQPLSSGIGARGMAYRVSPLEGLARALSGGLGAYALQQNVDQTKALAQRYGNALIGSVTQMPGSGGAAPNTQPNGGMVQGDNTNSAPAANGWTASVRNNNPGAMWPGPVASQFGATGAQNLNDGQGNKIATFPDPVSGAAAHFALLAKNYAGMPLSAAIQKWSGGNSSEQYTQAVSKATGLSPNTVLTPQLLASPQGVELAKAMARQEAGGEYPLSQEGWTQAQARAFGGSGVDQQPATAQGQPTGSAPFWRIPGVDDRTAYTTWMTDRQAWGQLMSAQIHANAPTPEMRNLAASNLTPEQQREQLALAAQKASGAFNPSEGTRVVQTPGGPQVQEIPGATEAKAHAEATKTFAVRQSEVYSKKLDQINADAQKAQEELPQVQLLTRVLKDKNFYSGWRAGNVEQMSSAARTLGLSDGQTATLMEFAGKLGSAASLGDIQEMGKAGAVRIPEMHMVEKSNYDKEHTVEANLGASEIHARILQRQIDRANMANAYADAHGGQIDRNFEQMTRDYFDKKQLFSDKELEDYSSLIGGKGSAAKAPQAKSSSLQPQPQSMPAAPKLGDVQMGHRYKGGDPALPASWEKLGDKL